MVGFIEVLLYQTTLALAGRQFYTTDIILMSVNSDPPVFERGKERRRGMFTPEECELECHPLLLLFGR